MASTRAQKLQNLQMSLPNQNSEFAKAQQQARAIQLQEQVKKLQPGTGGPQLAQQLGAAQTAAMGQIQTQQAQRGATQQQLLSQEGLAQRASEQRAAGFAQGIALNQYQQQQADRLSGIDRNLKTRLLDDQLQFRKDKAGQALLNERQMLDFALTTAKTEEEFQDYAQAAMQATERELQVLQAAQNKIAQVLEQGYIKGKGKLDREMQLELAKKKRSLEKRMQQKQTDAANKMARWKTAGTVFGAVAVAGAIVATGGFAALAAPGAATAIGVGAAGGGAAGTMGAANS